ncbi:MAG: ABC transporter permease subunit [Elusimicrobia bacterium]|nr:ABC transporter permease subunit [Elusimicrobiota bacterium]
MMTDSPETEQQGQSAPTTTPTKLALVQGQAVLALAQRELKGYFESPTAYVALIVFYLMAGYLYTATVFLSNLATVQAFSETVPLLLAFLVPALTMGLVSEELKSGTFETLATLPLEDWDITLGKFMGFAGVHLLTVAGLVFYPVLLSFLANPTTGLDWGETAGILLGLTLLGLMYGAIGLFASSLSRSQVVSFVIAFLLCFSFFIAGNLARFTPGPAATLLEFVGLDAHLDTLAKGVLDSRDILYFASVTFAFLYLTVRRLQSRRL